LGEIKKFREGDTMYPYQELTYQLYSL